MRNRSEGTRTFLLRPRRRCTANNLTLLPRRTPRTWVSLLLIAVGAVLAFAVHVTTSGFNINTVGIILLVVGAIGALISLIFWSSWGGFGNGHSETTVIER